MENIFNLLDSSFILTGLVDDMLVVGKKREKPIDELSAIRKKIYGDCENE